MSGLRFTESDIATMTARPARQYAFGTPRPVSQNGKSATAPTKTPKYRNQTQEVDGEKFRSKRELKRHRELLLLAQAGKIENLRREVPFVLVPMQRKRDGKAERDVKYVADFVYDHFSDGFREVRVEDTKGVRTKDYVIKRKLMLQVHKIEVVEV